jgi:uncharacterized protein involved in exopolysaccharide biosynthesis
VNLLERFRATWAWSFPALKYSVAAALIGAVGSLVMPPTYVSRSKVTLSSPSQATVSTALLGLVQKFGLASGGSAQGSPNYLLALMTSENVLEAVALARFPRADYADIGRTNCARTAPSCSFVDIEHVSGKNARDTVERAAKKVRSSFTAEISPASGVIELAVQGRSPLLAQVIAERLLQAVDSANVALQRAAGEDQFRFLRAQVDSARRTLQRAEDSLTVFDIENRSLASSPRLLQMRARLQRNASLAESFYTQLVGMLQQAYLAAANNVSTVSVIETPNLPGRRDSPKRKIIVLMAFGFGLVVWLLRRHWRLLYEEVKRLLTGSPRAESERANA